MMTRNTQDKRSYDPMVFWISAAVVVVFLIWGVFFPKNMSSGINAVFGWTTNYWGWLYLLTAFLLVGACFVLMGGKYGKMKLGLPEDTPEFSSFSWFGMLFGSAIAAGIVFWGPAEPAYHYMTPPPYFGGEAKTASIATAFPLMFLLLWVIYGTFRGLNAYEKDGEN